MFWVNATASIGTLLFVIAAVVYLLIRGGSRKEGLSQQYLDDEQAKAIRKWKENRK